MGNLGANTYFRVAVDSHAFTVLEVDGGLLYSTYAADDLFLYQGRRMGVAITASTRPGDYVIRTLGFDGGVFNFYGPMDLGILRVIAEEGERTHVAPPPRIPKHPRRPNKALFVPEKAVAAYRTFILSENSPTGECCVCGVGVCCRISTMKGWTIHLLTLFTPSPRPRVLHQRDAPLGAHAQVGPAGGGGHDGGGTCISKRHTHTQVYTRTHCVCS